MNQFEQLWAIASQKERAISRRCARRAVLSEEQALRQTLEMAAAQLGLLSVEQLVELRIAQRAAEEMRRKIQREQKAEKRRLRLEKLEPPAGSWLGWFDGSAHPHSRHCQIGVILRGPNGERRELRQEVGLGTNNDAEYLACIALLELALLAQAPLLVVQGDSQVVIGDLTATTADASPILFAHRTRALSVLAHLPEVRFRWIPRHKNAEADALSRRKDGG